MSEVGGEADDAGVEQRLLHHVDGGENAGNGDQYGHEVDGALDEFLTVLVHELVLREMQVSDNQEGGECDEEGVDEEEVEGADEVSELPGGDSVASGAERRHQGGGDGHAGDDGERLRLARRGHDAGESAEGGDQHVEDGGPGSRQQFRLRVAERGEQEVQGGGDQTDADHQSEVACRALEQLHVEGADGEADSVDGPHQRGDEHRADDDGGGVDVEPDGGDEDGEEEHPDVDAAELHRLRDGVDGGLHVGVAVDAQQLARVPPPR